MSPIFVRVSNFCIFTDYTFIPGTQCSIEQQKKTPLRGEVTFVQLEDDNNKIFDIGLAALKAQTLSALVYNRKAGRQTQIAVLSRPESLKFIDILR